MPGIAPSILSPMAAMASGGGPIQASPSPQHGRGDEKPLDLGHRRDQPGTLPLPERAIAGEEPVLQRARRCVG
jgi:hypothetical protein